MGRRPSSERTGVRKASESSIEISFYFHGKRCRPRIKGKPTPINIRRAEQFRDQVVESIENKTFDWDTTFPDSPCPFKQEKPLFMREYLESWIDDNEKYYRSSTVVGYRKIIKGHLIPAFGKLLLSQLRIKHVKEYISTLNAEPKTIGNIISPLRAALDDAVHDELIIENPIANYKIKRRRGAPSLKRKTLDPFTHDERQAILSKLTGQAKNFVQFAFWTGLRTSELIALDWGDIDFIRGVIYVSKALTQAAKQPEATKTAAGEREVKLLPDALAALQNQKAFTFLKDEEIFQNQRTKLRWTGDQAIRKTMWVPALKKAGVRYRKPYQTRHSFASMLLTDGERIQWVSEQLGHRDWTFTGKTYAKYMPDDDPNAGMRTIEANKLRKKS